MKNTWFLKHNSNADDDTPQIYIWIIFWFDIIDGIIGVMTFGYVQFDLSLRWIGWYLDRMKKKKTQDPHSK